ncbi:hypothetical protein V8F33_008969 [Rhypophila sp. PSN 637]
MATTVCAFEYCNNTLDGPTLPRNGLYPYCADHTCCKYRTLQLPNDPQPTRQRCNRLVDLLAPAYWRRHCALCALSCLWTGNGQSCENIANTRGQNCPAHSCTFVCRTTLEEAQWMVDNRIPVYETTTCRRPAKNNSSYCARHCCNNCSTYPVFSFRPPAFHEPEWFSAFCRWHKCQAPNCLNGPAVDPAMADRSRNPDEVRERAKFCETHFEGYYRQG